MNQPVVLDGATGTELERRGVDIGLPLWSARAILDAPQVLQDVHAAYLDAGARVVTANTFRTHQRSLAKAGMGSRWVELTRRAVDIACAARDSHAPSARIFGSVAPLEDCYRPDLAPAAGVCREAHEAMIRVLVDAGVDGVLIETMCAGREAEAAAEAARDVAPAAWAISFCFQSGSQPGVLLDGTDVQRLMPVLEQAQIVGVNCVAAPEVVEHVGRLRGLVRPEQVVAAYANIGYATPEGAWVTTDAVDPDRYAAYAAEWVSAGASMIGGCCGTTPETIRAIASMLGEPGGSL
ncbi:MAG: homocysteine S-methyltransferase family protein [Phycisphaerales bacterium]|nr:homocysteine S-methyltransferase family protein [Phycisphaerales bacterium]